MCALNKSSEEKPNIILCMADDQGWGDMAYNGHPVLQTPHFDGMAAEALRFDRFYAAAPVCSPTRGSVMTGRHPNRFGCFKWGHTLRPQEITLAEVLKQAGYITGHFGKWHLGSVCKGSLVNPGASGFDEWFSSPNFFDNDPIMSREGVAVQTEGESSMVTVDAALEFIEKHAGSDRPFLAVVWFGSPHNPHKAIDKDRDMYKTSDIKLRDFYGEITGMDRAFGKLRNRLRTLGIADNTILWYCSDNGGLPELGSTGGRGNKGMIYEGGLRVPAILEWPKRIKEHRVTAVPCNTSDIYPTLLEIADVKMPDQPVLDGISLVDLIDGKMTDRPRPMGFWSHPTAGISTPSAVWMSELLEAQKNGKDYSDIFHLRLDAGKITQQYPEDTFPGHAAWLDWPWKLHRIEDGDNIKFELYSLKDDPMEKTNVTDRNKDRVQTMKTELEKWQLSVVQSLNGMDYKK
ncbi:sulfatase-like hydrolase/transferase [candidate division KSB1 bacterium]|nr:sulfatase-like hydrolase/transferase [candidate division KSB1 bacterium]